MNGPQRTMRSCRRREGGAMLLTVIFLLVALGGLAAWLAGTLTSQHGSSANALLERQAAHAAVSGAEWLRERADGGVCLPLTSLDFAGFSLELTCAAELVVEDDDSYEVFLIGSEAQRGSYGDADFVRRSARARVLRR